MQTNNNQITTNFFTVADIKYGGEVQHNKLLISTRENIIDYHIARTDAFNKTLSDIDGSFNLEMAFTHDLDERVSSLLKYLMHTLISKGLEINSTNLQLEVHEYERQLCLDQLKHIEQGLILVINEVGGYFTVTEVDIVNEYTLTELELRKWLEDFKVPLDIAQRDSFSFVVSRLGTIYYKEGIYNHDTICRYYGLDCDKVYKFMYHLEDKFNNYNDFGIAGLQNSIVYEHADEPFNVSKSHLDSVEKFIQTELNKYRKLAENG